ncbi:hypothetical protein A5792_28845 [Mycolicibacterium peregrinum]|uniref:Type I restriction modification DNA specificity domain-containing protein n=1 Tax=Mycolicibacterium peregrinum TaxID=43304 RepID=A0A1A0QSJ2_MYCPR|nr:hypothetical protein A5792_28845 [Mycolicibacterium peregrinum]
MAIMPSSGPAFAYSPQLCYFRPVANGPLRARYLYYWFKSEEFWNQADALKGQTDMADFISLADIYSISMRLPSVDEQLVAIGILGAIDDKIAANERMTSAIAELLSANFRRAVSTAEAATVRFFDAFEVDFGEAYKSRSFSAVGVGRPLIRIRDLQSYAPQVWTTETRPGEVIVEPGDVLVGMDGEFRAKCWIGQPGLLNQRVCRIRAKEAGSAFVLEAIRPVLSALEREKSATTVIHLNKADLARSQLRVPQGRALAALEAVAEPLVSSYVAVQAESRQLARTRDELLPLLMSGKVSVADAEAVASEVL